MQQNKERLLRQGYYEKDDILLSGEILSLSEKVSFSGKYTEAVIKKVSCEKKGSSLIENKIGTDSILLTKPGQTVICQFYEDKNLKIGRQIIVTGELCFFKEARNPGEFNQLCFYQRRGTLFLVKNAKVEAFTMSYKIISQFLYEFKIKNEAMLSNYMEVEDAAIIKAMLFGNKNEIDSDVKKLFQKNGIAHILAISGLHLSLIGMSLYRLLRKIPIPLWLTAFVSESFMILYCIMVGFQASSLRALFMFSLFLFSKVVKRTYDLITALSLSCIVTLLLHPEYLFDCAFLLSFSSILGIGVFYRNFLKNILRPPKWMQSILVSAIVFLTTLPIVLYFYYEAAFYSIFLNLVVIPLMSILMGAAILLIFFMNSFEMLSPIPAYIVTFILKIYKVCCAFLEQYGMGRCNLGCPDFVQILLYYMIFFFIFNFGWKNKIKKIAGFSSGIFIALLVLLFRFQSGVDIYMLDVGQGDGSVIINENKNVYLVDGGSSSKTSVGEKRIIPFLKSMGVNEIEAVFISHPDQDHMNGIEELLQSEVREHIHIKQIFITDGLQYAKEFENLITIAKKKDIPVKTVDAGFWMSDDELMFRCIFPLGKGNCEELNNSSMVLELTYKEFNMLFTGDIEERGEEEIIRNIDQISQSIDILKVSHHGSNSSTSQSMLEWSNPKVALVSVGENNPYGHPHQKVIARLENFNCKILETKNTGCIRIHISRKGKWKIKRFVQ